MFFTSIETNSFHLFLNFGRFTHTGSTELFVREVTPSSISGRIHRGRIEPSELVYALYTVAKIIFEGVVRFSRAFNIYPISFIKFIKHCKESSCILCIEHTRKIFQTAGSYLLELSRLGITKYIYYLATSVGITMLTHVVIRQHVLFRNLCVKLNLGDNTTFLFMLNLCNKIPITDNSYALDLDLNELLNIGPRRNIGDITELFPYSLVVEIAPKLFTLLVDLGNTSFYLLNVVLMNEVSGHIQLPPIYFYTYIIV